MTKKRIPPIMKIYSISTRSPHNENSYRLHVQLRLQLNIGSHPLPAQACRIFGLEITPSTEQSTASFTMNEYNAYSRSLADIPAPKVSLFALPFLETSSRDRRLANAKHFEAWSHAMMAGGDTSGS